MNEKQINIIFADDDEGQHVALKDIVSEANRKSSDFKLNILQVFYNTNALKKYLSKGNDVEPDLLLLDIEFKGGESGIEALEMVRKLLPGLEITLLSAYDDVLLVRPAIQQYNVTYLKKPISANELLLHIAEIEKQKKEFQKLKDDLETYEELIDEIGKNDEETIPKDISDVIGKMFEHLKFHKLALKELLLCKDYKVYNILKNVDMGILTNAMFPKKIKKERVRGFDNITEYRFSQKGRIFISEQDTDKIVVCIDPNHRVFA
jgi:response regulator of citrate/malate metabolism